MEGFPGQTGHTGASSPDEEPKEAVRADTECSSELQGSKDGLSASGEIESTAPENLRHTQMGEEDASAAEEDEPFRLKSGDKVGRYVVLNEVGKGAMGVVYAAYDPELDRKLALKLLRPRSGTKRQQSAGRSRLLREAQALARLRHPNVVAVHDVGMYQGRVYVAMEFVEGETISAWLDRASPGRQEILRVLIEAGRGLAAAHEADLIHRDFKPDNVILASDGSVRVLDFGLARTCGERETTQRSATLESTSAVAQSVGTALASSLGASAFSAELTRTGGVMGTPAYMSPEQHLALNASPASDQFAFAVTLYEALYGERPFPGERVAALAFAVTQGNIREPTSGSSVPRWLRSVLLRALQPDSKARYADMGTLLEALSFDPRGAWVRRGGWIAGVAALGLFVWNSNQPNAAPVDPCTGVEAPFGEVWGPERATALEDHFGRSRLAFAGLSAQRVSTALDAWGATWGEARRETCMATRVHASQSDELFDRRMQCLDRALGRTSALIDRLSAASDLAIERAHQALESLPDLADCADTERLMAVAPRLSDRDKREADSIAAELDRVDAMRSTGDYKEAMEHLAQLDARVSKLADPLTELRHAETEASLRHFGEDDHTSVKSMLRAYLAADRAGDDLSRVRLATDLMETYGYGMAKVEEAAQWEAMAEAAVERIGAPPKARASLATARGTVLHRQAKYLEAIERHKEALALLAESEAPESAIYPIRQRMAVSLRELGRVSEAEAIELDMLAYLLKQVGPDHPELSVVLGSLGNSAYARASYAEAVEYYERVLGIIERSYGSESPRYYGRLNNYAAALTSMGHSKKAEAIHRKILAYNTARFGADDYRLCASLENIGNVLTAQARYEEAIESYEAALALKTKIHGPDHPAVATSKMNLGVALFSMGEYARAEELYLETLKVWLERLGPEHADLGLVYSNLGDVHEATGRYRSAVKYQVDAVRLFEKAWGPDNADIGWPLTGLGLAKLSMGDKRGALEALERARALRATPDAALPGGELARMEFAYARALPIDRRAEARALARASLSDARAGEKQLAADIEAWLEKGD